MKKNPIIMDVDTGIDDAIAITLALSRPELDVKCITTVAGNRTIETTTRNTLDVIAYLGKDVPVAKGAVKPLVKEAKISPVTHGESGLGNAVLPHTDKKPIEADAITAMREILENSPEKVTLVPTGPLTNIAILLFAHPHVKEKIEKIVLMGGGAFEGNVNAAAEYNIYSDPEAASVVFKSGLPIVMCGLDVTMKAYATADDIERIRKTGTNAGKFCADALEYYYNRYKINSRLPGCAVNDAVTIAYIVNPEIVTAKPSRVLVDIDGVKSYGCTASDFRPDRDRSLDNALVCTDIDREKFIDMLVCAAESYK